MMLQFLLLARVVVGTAITTTSTTSTTTVEPVEHCAQFVTYPQQECQSKLVKEKAENGVECDCEGQTPCHSLFRK